MVNKIAIALCTTCLLFGSYLQADGQQSSVYQLYRNLVDSPTASLPTEEEFFTKINESTVVPLSEAELDSILPLARQCLYSARPEVRRDGLLLFLAAVLRPDGAKMLEPYIADFATLLTGEHGNNSQRRGVFYLLGSMKPKLPPKATALLKSNLSDKNNSSGETLTIAASLIEAAPSDTATVHEVLSTVSMRDDPILTDGALRQLGLSKCKVPEALDLMASSLQRRELVASAVDAVSRLDADDRRYFRQQLEQVASDPDVPAHVRNQAKAATGP
jgi:hypothetical protein